MQNVLQQLVILYVFLFIGWLIGKVKKDKIGNADILSVLIVNVFLPCKVFNTFSNNVSVSYFFERWPLLVASIILLISLVIIARFASKLFTKNEYEQKVYAYSIPITNYAYLGYVLIGSVFGEEILAEFMFFALPFVFYTYTFGYSLLTNSKIISKKIINPITIAIVLGLTFGLAGLKLPKVIITVLSMSSNCVGPLSMLLTGITLSTFALRELLSNKTAYIFAFIRLILIPAIAYLICLTAKLTTILPMVLIITCMPCGLNPIIFPKLINEDCKPGARLALITHIFSIATLPFWLSLII